MLITWEYNKIELSERNKDEMDYSVDPRSCHMTVAEDLFSDLENYEDFSFPTNIISYYDFRQAIIAHFGLLKRGGFFDFLVNPFDCERVIDQEMVWDRLNPAEQVKFVQRNVLYLKFLGYSPERLQMKVGDQLIFDLGASVRGYLGQSRYNQMLLNPTYLPDLDDISHKF